MLKKDFPFSTLNCCMWFNEFYLLYWYETIFAWTSFWNQLLQKNIV